MGQSEGSSSRLFGLLLSHSVIVAWSADKRRPIRARVETPGDLHRDRLDRMQPRWLRVAGTWWAAAGVARADNAAC
jgi:hypothetical protein